MYLHLLSLESLSLHCPVFIQIRQFFVVPRGEYSPPLLDPLLLWFDEELGDLNPAELGDRVADSGFEKVFPFVCVVLRAWPLGDRPLGDDPL